MATKLVDEGSTWWQAAVHEGHDRLLALIGELESLTAHPAPDMARIASVRWRLAQASREHRAMLDRLMPELSKRGFIRHAEALRWLKQDESTRIAASAQHIAKWTTETIAADWRGYCEASARVRKLLRDRVAAERDALDLC